MHFPLPLAFALTTAGLGGCVISEVPAPMQAALTPEPSGFSIDPQTPVLLPLRGATAGDPYALTCGADELVVGLVGQSDSTVQALGLICARMLQNGRLVDEEERPVIGGGAGDDFVTICPRHEAVIELRGRAGTSLDRIGVRCARVRPWTQQGTPGAITPSYGGPGGSPFTESCPTGYMLHGLLGHASAGTIDSAQGLCVPVTQ
jgi:hypothetical protein